MVSEGVLKSLFVEKILVRDAQNIRARQFRIVRENFTNKSGRLLQNTSENNFSLLIGDNMAKLMLPMILYLRFIDRNLSKDRYRNPSLSKKLSLYNRIIWGRFYNETYNDLKGGLTDTIRAELTEKLQESASI